MSGRLSGHSSVLTPDQPTLCPRPRSPLQVYHTSPGPGDPKSRRDPGGALPSVSNSNTGVSRPSPRPLSKPCPTCPSFPLHFHTLSAQLLPGPVLSASCSLAIRPAIQDTTRNGLSRAKDTTSRRGACLAHGQPHSNPGHCMWSLSSTEPEAGPEHCWL